MSAVDKFLSRANRLFISISDEFKLVYCDGIYNLQNPWDNSCHFLEICLLGKTNLSGKKIADISKIIHMSPKWVVGFYFGFGEKPCKYINAEFRLGYVAGREAKAQAGAPSAKSV